MTCIPLLFMPVLLMFYRSTMLIITHVYNFFSTPNCMRRKYKRKSMYNVYSHGNVCSFFVVFCSLSFFLRQHAFFIFVWFLFFRLSLSLPTCLSVSFSVIVVASWNSDTCSTMMRVAFPPPSPRNTHIYTQQIHANCFDSCLGMV